MKNLLILIISTWAFIAQGKRLPNVIFLKDSLIQSKDSIQLKFRIFQGNNNVVKEGYCFRHQNDSLSFTLDSSSLWEITIHSNQVPFSIAHKWFKEELLDTSKIKQGHSYFIELHMEPITFSLPNIDYHYDKPVIYYFPDTITDFEISLDFKGDLKFTYPNIQDGWKGTAYPDGKLDIKQKNYGYLFWEGKSHEVPQFDKSKGFIVKRDSLVTFFEKKLSILGLHDRVQQDFISYWVPLMLNHEKVFIHFLDEEIYNQIAPLSISPQVNFQTRIFMIWEPTKLKNIEEQQLKAVQMGPNCLIEWGGMRLSK